MFEEIPKDAIRAEAHTLLKRFSEKLAGVNAKNIESKPESSGMRHNEVVKTADSDFKEMMFANATKKDSDFIYGETKKW